MSEKVKTVWLFSQSDATALGGRAAHAASEGITATDRLRGN